MMMAYIVWLIMSLASAYGVRGPRVGYSKTYVSHICLTDAWHLTSLIAREEMSESKYNEMYW